MTTPTTSVPSPIFGPTGFIAPAESAVLAGVQADFNAALGGNLNPNLETPQGQLESSLTAIIGDKNNTFVKYTQQVDPAYADGRMQDGIARIYFIERNPAQPTVVEATVTGLAGVVIPLGSLAVATDGNLYSSISAVTIPVGGSTTAEFACNTVGPVACPAHALSAIYKAIPGWDSIDNAADGVLGNEVESRADFEFRRQQSVFLNSIGSVPAIRAAVLEVPNVLDAYVIDNATNAPATVGGVTLAAHNLFVSVVGGDPDLIAQAIWSKKAPGCPYYAGGTTRTVYDTRVGSGPPYPSYAVTFNIPTPLPIKFSVALAANGSVPPDAASQVTAAIVAAFAGADGGPRARIGTTLFASRFVVPVAALGAWVNLTSLQIGTSTPNAGTVTVDIDKVPTVATTDISVTIS